MATCTLIVRVRPRAGRQEVHGRRPDGALEIWVKAAPEGGKANAEVIAVLARALRVPRNSIDIVTGASGRQKLLRIDGMAPAALAARLAELVPGRGEARRQQRPESDGRGLDGRRRDEQGSNEQIQDKQAEDGQTEDGQAEDGQAEDGQAEDGQAEDGQAEDEQGRDRS